MMGATATRRSFGLLGAALMLSALLATAAAAKGKLKPTGTFKNKWGTIKLAYLGEGTVSIDLKTRYCKLVDTSGGGTFAFPHVVVYDKETKPLLVIFVERRKITVFGGLERFTNKHCKGGKDVTGVYKRSR